jgi:L-ascorbate metabolism protein UlaG (beta-lactamase superfamily)
VTAGADAAAAEFRWYGQAMFSFRTPGGTNVLTDPFGNIGYTVPTPEQVGAGLTTITHEHPDHNNDALGGRGLVMRGLTADGWNHLNDNVGDLRVRTVRTFHDDQQGAQRGRNAIFVFELAGLRIAHLGDLGHQLDDQHVSSIGGPVDVLMVPVGGVFTLDGAGATQVVQRLGPKVVFPMHYQTARAGQALQPVDLFLDGKTVQRVGSTTTRLAKDTLPAQTTVMVLDYE